MSLAHPAQIEAGRRGFVLLQPAHQRPHRPTHLPVGQGGFAHYAPRARARAVAHREKRRGLIESEGPVGLWSVMSAGSGGREQADESLEHFRQLGFLVRLCSKLFGSHEW
jgi:hypothetical protein